MCQNWTILSLFPLWKLEERPIFFSNLMPIVSDLFLLLSVNHLPKISTYLQDLEDLVLSGSNLFSKLLFPPMNSNMDVLEAQSAKTSWVRAVATYLEAVNKCQALTEGVSARVKYEHRDQRKVRAFQIVRKALVWPNMQRDRWLSQLNFLKKLSVGMLPFFFFFF